MRIVAGQFRFSSSPGGSLPRGPHQIRTWRFPPSGSSADVARGSRATTVRSRGDMIRRRRSAGHGSLRTITPTRAAFARPGPGGYPFPGVIARMQPSDSLIPIGLGSGRPLPSAYPGARATRSNEGLPGVRAVLFQRAVVVDPAGCGALLAHGAGTAVAFRLHEALGTQEDVVSRLQGLRPTRSRTYASATALPRSPQGSLPAWVGWPLTGRGSHPLDDTQGFMTYSSIPLDRPAWPHHAPTPRLGVQQSAREATLQHDAIEIDQGTRPRRRAAWVRRDWAAERTNTPREVVEAHGFRSSFRDWAAERTNTPREVVEAALAHTVQNPTEAAYARSDLFERRRRLMDDWAAYLSGAHEHVIAP